MRVGTLGVLAILGAAGLPATAEARWSRPTAVRGTAVASGPVLASNGRGDVLVAWTDVRGHMRYALAHRGGSFGRVHRIPGATVETYPGEISAALAADGSAAISWDDCRGELDDPTEGPCRMEAWAAARKRGHPFARAKLVSDPGLDAFSSSVAAGPGRATVVFSDGSDVYASRSNRDGRFRRTRRIAAGSFIAVTIAADRVETFTYTAEAGIKALRRLPSGRRRAPRLLTRSEPYSTPLVSASAGGREAVLWDREGPASLHAGVSVDGHPLRTRGLDHPGQGAGYGYGLGGSPSGEFVAAFVRQPEFSTGRHQLRYSRSRPGHGFSRPRDVPRARTDSAPHVAVSTGGHALVSWLDESGGAVAVAEAARGGDFASGRTYPLDHPIDTTCEAASDLCDLPDVALDGRGHGYMVWPDGTRLRVARYRDG
jgi:hypothetical protein